MKRFKRAISTLVLVGLMLAHANSSTAQALKDEKARTAAHIGSWVTVALLEGLDTLASFRAPDRKRALILQGVRMGVVQGSVLAMKTFIPSARPCAPAHACGQDGENSGFPSGHAAMACSTLGGPGIAISIPLMGATGAGRWLAWRHDIGQLATGCFIGIAASRIR